jgi:hypothetical protein
VSSVSAVGFRCRHVIWKGGTVVLSLITAVALLLVYEAVPGISLAFPAWVAGSSVLILVRRRAVQNADGA